MVWLSKLTPSWLGATWAGTAWNGLERLGTAWNGLERLGTAWNGLERLGTAWNGLERLGLVTVELLRSQLRLAALEIDRGVIDVAMGHDEDGDVVKMKKSPINIGLLIH